MFERIKNLRRNNRPNRNDQNAAHLSGNPSVVVPDEPEGAGHAPILSVSVGSTGLNRTLQYYDVMKQMNCQDRIQCMAIYDCNLFQIRKVREKMAQDPEFAAKVVLPEYLPFAEGFLRRVDQYKVHYGAIERDMEQMAEKMRALALDTGSEPQAILEWVGFGGHSKLTFMFHDIVAEYFHEASYLPIVSFPDERSMQRNIREHGLWRNLTEVFVRPPDFTPPILLTDNRCSTDFQRIDQSVVMALGVIEGSFHYDSSYSTLAEVIAEFQNSANRWLVIEHADIPIKIKTENYMPTDESINNAIIKISQSIKKAIHSIAEPEITYRRSSYFKLGTAENDQRIYVIMPYDKTYMDKIRDDVEDQLKREGFGKNFPGTRVAYANMRSASTNSIQVIKLVGLNEKPVPYSITTITDDKLLPDDFLKRRNSSIYDVRSSDWAEPEPETEPSFDEERTSPYDRDERQSEHPSDEGRESPQAHDDQSHHAAGTGEPAEHQETSANGNAADFEEPDQESEGQNRDAPSDDTVNAN